MRNLKHTTLAVTAVALVGTLSFLQMSDMSAKRLERDMKISSANRVESITIASTENEEGTVALALPTAEDAEAEADVETDYETEQAIAEKQYLTLGYAKVTGSVEIKTAPNDDSANVGSMSGADQVEILESTDGWYKVSDNGQIGYVHSDDVTLDKSSAQESALQYDHYKKASVTADSGLVVRQGGSVESNNIGMVGNGEDIIVVGQEGDYIKVVYGSDYSTGYVLSTGVELTGDWVTKDEVHSQIKKIAARKEEEARRAAAAAAAAASGSSSGGVSPSVTYSSAASGGGQSIVGSAMKYLGVRYVWGGTSPSGFDCSGLVQYVCRANGISVPRTAAAQYSAGRKISRSELRAGDLVFFSSGRGISHVGIYVGNGNMIHAPQTGDVVKISSINTSYRVSHYAGAVRVTK